MKEKMMRLYNNTKNGVQKHSPEILAGVGVVGTVASAVMACKATLKLDDILAETKETTAVETQAMMKSYWDETVYQIG